MDRCDRNYETTLKRTRRSRRAGTLLFLIIIREMILSPEKGSPRAYLDSLIIVSLIKLRISKYKRK